MSQPLPFFFPVQVHPSPPYTAGPRLHPAWRLGKRDNHHTGRRHVEHGSLVAIKNGCLARNNGGLSRKNGDLTHQNCVLELYHCFFSKNGEEWLQITWWIIVFLPRNCQFRLSAALQDPGGAWERLRVPSHQDQDHGGWIGTWPGMAMWSSWFLFFFWSPEAIGRSMINDG